MSLCGYSTNHSGPSKHRFTTYSRNFLQDREVLSTLWHMSMFLAPPTDVLAPWLLFRLARQALYS